MKSWDAIVVGGGMIGMSLAISLRKQGLHVLVVERGEPGREASYAAAGMLVGSGDETPAPVASLAQKSAGLYPEFTHELEEESGMKVDLREQGTIRISRDGNFPEAAEPISPERLASIEPALGARLNSGQGGHGPSAVARDARVLADFAEGRQRRPLLRDPGGIVAAYMSERSVDPRALVSAAVKAARHRGVDISSGSEAKTVLSSGGRVTGVQTDKTSYSAGIVVNCAGAWSGCVAPHKFPVRPVKGQMLAVVGGPALQHVVRADEVYLVPRSDGRIVIGSTLEDAGYDKRTNVHAIQQLFQAALELVPGLSQAKKHEDWAGLRPGTPDDLPILGNSATNGYWIASGHYRDGILLAPITAQVMTELILKRPLTCDLTAFSPSRFPNPAG